MKRIGVPIVKGTRQSVSSVFNVGMHNYTTADIKAAVRI
jgi:hypothetical protein